MDDDGTLPRKSLVRPRKVTERYDITDRTLARWLDREDLQFPRPIEIAGRRYFVEEEIIAWEQSRAAAKREDA